MLFKNYWSNLYEIYRGESAGYLDLIYKISSDSKIFINLKISTFSGYSGLLEPVYCPNKLEELKNLLIWGVNGSKTVIIKLKTCIVI